MSIAVVNGSIIAVTGNSITITLSGNVTGVQLQGGWREDQPLKIVNTSPYAMTFHTNPAQSLVSGSDSGVTVVAYASLSLVWSGEASRWIADLDASTSASVTVNIKDYNPDITGASLCDTSIARAFAALPASGGSILFPDGIYKYSGITLSGLTDVSIIGVGTASILAPTSGHTAITITNGTRCHVSNLKIDGSINGGAIGLSISGDLDSRFQNLHITGLSGDAIFVQGDATIGNEIHFAHVTCRNNGGYGYHYARTTLTDTGGVYFNDFSALYNTQGLGGINIDASAAVSSVGTFHWFMNTIIDSYTAVNGIQIHNAHHNRFIQSWFANLATPGKAVLLLDGDGYMNDFLQAYIVNTGSGAGTYNIAINGTQHDNQFDQFDFDGNNVTAHVHQGSSGANNFVNFYNIFGGQPLTDTQSALYSRGTVVQQFGPLTVEAPGSGSSSSFGLDDPTNPGKQKWLRNSNGSFQLLNAAFSSTIFRVDDGGFTVIGGPCNLNGGSSLMSGSGAPGSGIGSQGDYYFRTDTPSIANQRIYVKTGSSTWVGIV